MSWNFFFIQKKIISLKVVHNIQTRAKRATVIKKNPKKNSSNHNVYQLNSTKQHQFDEIFLSQKDEEICKCIAKNNISSYHRKSKVCQRRNANVFFYAISTLHGCHTDAVASSFLLHNNHYCHNLSSLSSSVCSFSSLYFEMILNFYDKDNVSTLFEKLCTLCCGYDMTTVLHYQVHLFWETNQG